MKAVLTLVACSFAYSLGQQLVTECKESSPGKFTCEGVKKEDITLRSEHILWLNGQSGEQKLVDIAVPNYQIDELIKAGFKPSTASDTKINVLLKKPEQTYAAQTEAPKTAPGKINVNLQYEPVTPVKVHFPNDKQYQPLSGPIDPPPKK